MTIPGGGERATTFLGRGMHISGTGEVDAMTGGSVDLPDAVAMACGSGRLFDNMMTTGWKWTKYWGRIGPTKYQIGVRLLTHRLTQHFRGLSGGVV